MSLLKSAKGTFDLLPYGYPLQEPWRNIQWWHYVEEVIRKLAHDYALQEIRTPLFEHCEVFSRTSGEFSDVVLKEMYTFSDRKKRLLALRPELTAAVVRSFLQHHLDNHFPHHRFYYTGAMFRYSRPQAGRYRQFHQFGIELIGAAGKEEEIELLDLVHTLYDQLSVSNAKLVINTLGENQERKEYGDALYRYLTSVRSQLSSDSALRLEKNPLRILDSKEEQDQALLKKAPVLLDFLSSSSQDRFHSLTRSLDALSIPYEIDPFLVRGLDYYEGLVFEVVTDSLGAQNSLGGGGRYNALFEQLGSSAVPSIGFSMGIERVIQAMIAEKTTLPTPSSLLFVLPMEEEDKQAAFLLLKTLRQHHFSCMMDFSVGSIKRQLRYANKRRSDIVLILGEEERKANQVMVKEMRTGESKRIDREEIVSYLRTCLRSFGTFPRRV